MDPTTAEPQPGCLVILTPLSAAMAEDVRVWLAHRSTADGEPEISEVPKSLAARFLADELLESLANTLDAGYSVPLDVAALGYFAADDGALQLVSLLPGDPAARLVPLADIAGLAVEMRNRAGDPRKWCRAAECSGTAPAATAMAEVYKLVSVWLTGRFAARPPVIIHCTGGEGLDDTYARNARSLGLLTTAYGPARLLHVGFIPDTEPVLCGMGELPLQWASLHEVSAELMAEPEGRPARRAVSINDWAPADAWAAIFDNVPVDEALQRGEHEADPASLAPFQPSTTRGMWTQKMGNSPEQWEDAFALEPASGTCAVADGASSGIYCRTWADQLVKRFLSDRPNMRDPVALGKWVHVLRGEWRAAIDYDKLNWSKKAKVDETGAAATFLGLEVGPADTAGNRPWRACAVGDASLFWVRSGSLIGSFPVVAEDQFGSAPLLIRSNPGFKTLALAAAGTCQPGDRFLLATDAVAARLFKSAALGPGPDWERFETMDELAWRAELDTLRQAHDMVNDDCTLVSLRVSAPPSDTQEPPVLPTQIGQAESVPELFEIAEPDESTPTPENERTPTRDGFSDSTEPTV